MNWGIVPFTGAEIAHAGKKLRPVVFKDLVQIAKYDGDPNAFMMTPPDVDQMLRDLDGELYPLGCLRLLLRLRGGCRGRPTVTRMWVTSMGAKVQHQSSRLASQLTFVMIERIRRDAVTLFSAQRAKIGGVAEDNRSMVLIADTIGSWVAASTGCMPVTCRTGQAAVKRASFGLRVDTFRTFLQRPLLPLINGIPCFL